MSSHQVTRDHYQFGRYMSKERWVSLWHQLAEISLIKANNVLEIGVGGGTFKLVATSMGIDVKTIDIDPALQPDYVASVRNLPFRSNSFDAACAFQVLEHLPYKFALQSFAEVVRVARSHILISLPDAQRVWRFVLHVPGVGPWSFQIPRPTISTQMHQFDGEHYWEINKRGFELARVIADLSTCALLRRTFRVPEFPYHRFFLFEKRAGSSTSVTALV